MDWMTFVSSDVKALAWPTAAIIALFVLKGHIIELLRALGNRLETAEGAGIELTFGKGVDEVEEILPAPETVQITTPQDAQRVESISELSQLPPPYIVSQAWLRLEQAIRLAVGVPPIEGRTPVLSTRRYTDLAHAKGLLTDEEMPAVLRLRELRNQAAHSVDPDITITDALRYHDIADTLIQKIKER